MVFTQKLAFDRSTDSSCLSRVALRTTSIQSRILYRIVWLVQHTSSHFRMHISIGVHILYTYTAITDMRCYMDMRFVCRLPLVRSKLATVHVSRPRNHAHADADADDPGPRVAWCWIVVMVVLSSSACYSIIQIHVRSASKVWLRVPVRRKERARKKRERFIYRWRERERKRE